eukprot:1041442-Amorphochlora_amoeboformis.AAC.1
MTVNIRRIKLLGDLVARHDDRAFGVLNEASQRAVEPTVGAEYRVDLVDEDQSLVPIRPRTRGWKLFRLGCKKLDPSTLVSGSSSSLSLRFRLRLGAPEEGAGERQEMGLCCLLAYLGKLGS